MRALVLVASGLHLGYIGCYGNEWVQTPALDRLAAEGIVFDQHYADQPDAAGAQRAWQTGCYGFPSLATPDEESLPETANRFPLLAERGVATFRVSDDANRFPSAEPAGWQQSHLLEPAAVKTALPEQMRDTVAKALIRLAPCKEWLLKFDLAVSLPPWNIPDEYRNRYTAAAEHENQKQPPSVSIDPDSAKLEEIEDLAYRELQDHYAAVVTYLDTGVGQVLHELERRGLLEDMFVLVTSDRGQELGEEAARPRSCLALHEEVIHIPLIVRLPGMAEAGRRIAVLTQPVDLLPTLLEAFGLPLPAVHGHSLLPLMRGESEHIRAYACAGLHTGDTVEWALRSPDWSFLLPVTPSSSVLPRESELYVKPDDRWEVNNVRQHHLELAERLEQTLRCFVEATRRPGPLRPPEIPHLGLAKDEPHHSNDSTERSISP